MRARKIVTMDLCYHDCSRSAVRAGGEAHHHKPCYDPDVRPAVVLTSISNVFVVWLVSHALPCAWRFHAVVLRMTSLEYQTRLLKYLSLEALARIYS